MPEKNLFIRLWNNICIGYFFLFGLMISLIKGEKDVYKLKKQAIELGLDFLKSREYLNLPRIEKI